MGASHMETLAERMLDQGDKKHRVQVVTAPYTMQNGKVVQGIRRDAVSQRFNLLNRKTRQHDAYMSAQTMPGCCGAVIFYNFSGEALRAQKLVEFGYKAAQAAGYGLVVATLRTGSNFDPGVVTATFVNGKTGNEINLLTKYLKQTVKPPVEDNVILGNEG